MAEPTGENARQQMAAATGRPHLENCTGRNKDIQNSAKNSGSAKAEDSSQKPERGSEWRTQDRKLISIVLGVSERSNAGSQDQARKSAGWMPGH